MIWSKLQKQLYKIMDSTVKFQMHCSVFKTKSAWNAGQKAGISKKKESIPHYWITVNGETVWDFPNNYIDNDSLVDGFTLKEVYFYPDNYNWIADVLRNYINTPKEQLLTIKFDNDKFGLVDVLRKYDRRISKHKRKDM